ncbi:MAG: hypothetical protein ACYC9O_12730, partial [Candidatus Latescibacterota bacterium]
TASGGRKRRNGRTHEKVTSIHSHSSRVSVYIAHCILARSMAKNSAEVQEVFQSYRAFEG